MRFYIVTADVFSILWDNTKHTFTLFTIQGPTHTITGSLACFAELETYLLMSEETPATHADRWRCKLTFCRVQKTPDPW